MKLNAELDVLKLILDHRAAEEDEIALGARQVWATYYGKVRASGKGRRAKRIDFMKPRGPSSKLTEAGWLRKRREEVGAGARAAQAQRAGQGAGRGSAPAETRVALAVGTDGVDAQSRS